MIYSHKNKRTGETWWYIRYDLVNVGKRQTRHEKVSTSKQDAKERLEDVRVQICKGTFVDPKAPVPVKDYGPTFDEFADRFESDYGALRRSGYYKQILKRLRGHFGSRRLREITAADLDAYRAICKADTSINDSTTRKLLTALGTLFKKAKKWEVLAVNPADDLEKPSQAKGKTRFLTRDEWTQFHAAAEPWLKPILTVAVSTGMRLKEVVGLTWENVDRQGELLYVSEDNKTGEPRQVPLTATVRDVIDAQVRHVRSPFVFLNSLGSDYTTPRHRNRISQRTVAAAKAAKLSGVSFHTLRHTAGSWMAQAGVSNVKIQKMLGHKNTATTDRYMHLAPGHLKAPAEAIEAILNGRVSVASPESGKSAANVG